MPKGKNTCRILKEIRRQIAEANDIAYVVEECHYRGDCPGTCPKCEAEVKYLEDQLNQRRMLGKAVAVVGVSLGLSLSAAAMPSANSQISPLAANDTTISVQQIDSLRQNFNGRTHGKHSILGRIIGSDGYPLIEAHVSDTTSNDVEISDVDGFFVFRTDKEDITLKIAFVGCVSKNITIKREEYNQFLNILLEDDENMMGEVLIVKKHKSIIPKFLRKKKTRR